MPALIPEFIDRPSVLGIGEIGLNKNSRNELKVLEMHIDLAARHDQLILVHTPHLEDKLKGTPELSNSGASPATAWRCGWTAWPSLRPAQITWFRRSRLGAYADWEH